MISPYKPITIGICIDGGCLVGVRSDAHDAQEIKVLVLDLDNDECEGPTWDNKANQTAYEALPNTEY